MGGGSWSSSRYDDASKTRAKKGIADFDYSDGVSSGRYDSKVHDTLDPAQMKTITRIVNGNPVEIKGRESRDSDEHPLSLPIGMIFDVTGSMGITPQKLQKKLSKLMDVVIAKAEIEHPQVLVGAVGDATCDKFPLQVGEFESDNRFDDQLRQIILEGGGGGQARESYGLAYKFAADHVALDSWEKRGKKGYFFTMGDESFWPTLPSGQLATIFGGEHAGEDERFESVLARAQEHWEVFHLFAVEGSYASATDIHDSWRNLLGERFVMVENSDIVCEVIAGLIHGLETSYDITKVVGDLDLSAGHAALVTKSLMPVLQAKASGAIAKGNLPGNHPDS